MIESYNSGPCPLPIGSRIRLILMAYDPDPVPPGTEGTVTGGNAMQIWVQWDVPRSLALVPGVDQYTVLSEPSPEPH